MTRYNVFWQRRLWHLLLILVAILISFSRARQMRVCLFVAWVLSQLAFRVLLVSGEQALGYSDRRHGVNNLSRLPGSYLPSKPTLRAALTTVIINTDASVVERHTSGRLLERERCRKRRRRPEGAAATASVTANSSNDNHYIIAADATTTTATVATFLA